MTETSPITEALREVHERFRDNLDGEVATYIPELARVDPDRFGIALAMTDGRLYEVGDSRARFTIQSVSKAFVYGLALRDHGREHLLQRVGVEPTGDPFNAILLDETNNRPPNPMVNAGAIGVTGLVLGDDVDHRWQRIVDTLSAFAGRPLDVDAAVAASERETGHRNRAIAHLMRGFDMLRPEVDEVLDLYFRQCAVLVDAADLAMMGATLAAGGRQPVTGESVLTGAETASVLSVMSSCGMYDASGEWIYRVGLPAKSGVGGGIVAVLPGQAAIAVFSPRLDAQGNSVRGHLVCEELSAMFGLHVFDDRRTTISMRAAYDRRSTASLHVRVADDEAALQAHGAEIAIVELQGTLNFSSLERLCRHVAEATSDAIDLVIDLRRVVGVEPVAARLLAELIDQRRALGVTVTLSSPGADVLVAILAAVDDRAAPHPSLADDLDRAVEAAETRLLGRRGSTATARVQLADVGVCAGLGDEAVAALAGVLDEIAFDAGTVVARPGDSTTSAWLLLDGLLAVSSDADGRPGRRLRTAGPASILGEMALLSGEPRSAWVVAHTPVVALELTPAALAEFAVQCPHGAVTLMRNMGSLLGRRLRDMDRLTAHD